MTDEDSRTQEWTRLVTRVLAPNPGPMTLEGTNSLVVRHPGSRSVVVIDPGPREPDHLRRLASHGDVELILLTHGHHDHVESAEQLAHMTGAPVRAIDPALTRDASALVDGEVIAAAGCRIVVLATPGHTMDSACFFLPDDRPLGDAPTSGSMATGDTLLGRGSTVITEPGGSLAEYLASVERLRESGDAAALPGHGPILDHLGVACEAALFHRHARLEQIESALAEAGVRPSDDPETVDVVVRGIYSEVAPDLADAVRRSVLAQLVFLAGRDG